MRPAMFSKVSLSRLSRGVLLFVFVAMQLSYAVTRQKYDFVVGVDGDFKAAAAAAAKSASTSDRFYIFFPDGNYDIGSLMGDTNQMTTFTTSNVSFIGQSEDNTVIYNKATDEGISITATLFFKDADNLYLQDLTVYNKANYGQTSTYGVTGRYVAIEEQGDKIVYKRVKLLSTQDTYYTRGTRTYWEDGVIHGTTDFVCGGGDVFFQNCTLYALKKSALTAPATTSTWGYVFNGCTIDGDVSDFTLGRSWKTGREVFINTTMDKLPTTLAWADPINSVPQVAAEYNSMNSSGTAIDLSGRRASYTDKNGGSATLDPTLTPSEAANYTVSNVLSGSDGWAPQNLTRQVSAPVAQLSGMTITWNANDSALCWVIFRNGKYLANVITNSYGISALSAGDTITVRAANEMGGLGESSNKIVIGTQTSSSSTASSSSATGSSSAVSSGKPTVTFVAPTDGADYSTPATITVEVTATDGDGSIDSVQLYLNGEFIRRETGSPYAWNDASQDTLLRNMAAGTYVLRAVAFDNSGNQGESSVRITVADKESIRIRSKVDPATPAKKYFDLLGRSKKEPMR